MVRKTEVFRVKRLEKFVIPEKRADPEYLEMVRGVIGRQK